MSQNIDKIIYINLNKRSDRKDEIENELNNFNLNYERFAAIENAEFGTLGCLQSHLAVLKLARERGYKNVLILEDDFTFLVSKEEFEKNLTQFFDSNIEYNVCMISYKLMKQRDTPYDFLWKSIEVQTGSGYIVNANYYNKLIDLYEWAMPKLAETKMHWVYASDQIWKQYQPHDNWFCFKTRLGKQRESYSDNCLAVVDHKC